MNRQDFLRELQRALTGLLSNEEIVEHVEYYSQYIEVAVRKGEAEEEIISELGDPKLLAKTILTVRSDTGSANSFKEGRQHGGILAWGNVFFAKIKNKMKEMWKRLE